MKKPTYSISDWSIIISRTPYMAPEVDGIVKLSGKIDGHPKFNSGDRVETTELFAIDPENNTAETKKAFYNLGEMDAGWVEYLKENNYTIEQYSKYLKKIEDVKRDQEKKWKKYEGDQFFDDNFSVN